MKRVAIIGCSHSDYRQGSTQAMWAKTLSDRFTNLEFHNFSRGGYGHLYQDMMLKYVRFFQEPYDLYIVQLTGMVRWFVPTEGYSDYWDYNNIQDTFNMKWLSNNHISYTWNLPRVASVGVEPLDPHKGIDRNIYRMYDNNGFNTKDYPDLNIKKNVSGAVCGIGNFHSYCYFEELKHLAKNIPLYWFTPRTYIHWINVLDNNLNLPTFSEWLEQAGTTMDDNLDDTAHLTVEGNRILFEDYLLPSILGKKLIDLNGI